MTSSIKLTSKTPGIKPAPIPWILCGPRTLKNAEFNILLAQVLTGKTDNKFKRHLILSTLVF